MPKAKMKKNILINFSSIPIHLIQRILQLVPAHVFIRIQRTCKVLYRICHLKSKISIFDVIGINFRCIPPINERRDRLRTVLAWPGVNIDTCRRWRKDRQIVRKTVREMLPFRVFSKSMTVNTPLSPLVAQTILTIAREQKIKVNNFAVHFPISCSADQLQLIFKTIHPESVMVSIEFSKYDYPPEIFESVPKFQVNKSDYATRDVLRVKHEEFESSCIEMGSRGLNQFLKEWLNGQRKIKRVKLSKLDLELNIEEALEGLPASLFYDLNNHKNSIIRLLSPETFSAHYFSYNVTKAVFYVLIKSGNIMDTLLFETYPSDSRNTLTVTITQCVDPVQDFYSRIGVNYREKVEELEAELREKNARAIRAIEEDKARLSFMVNNFNLTQPAGPSLSF